LCKVANRQTNKQQLKHILLGGGKNVYYVWHVFIYFLNGFLFFCNVFYFKNVGKWQTRTIKQQIKMIFSFVMQQG